MSKIEEMLKRLCPEGVERVPFSLHSNYIRGITYSKNDETENTNDSVGVLRANNITLESCVLNLEEVKRVVSTVRIKDEQYLKLGDVLICAGSGSKAHIGKVAYIDENSEFTFGGFMAVIRSDATVNNKFIFYILRSKEFKCFLNRRLSGGAAINNLDSTIMSEFLVPLPPRPVQDEIVKALDAMDAAVKALEEERAARQEQFEAMRERIWDCDEKLVPLSEIATEFYRGAGILRTQVTETGIPCVRYGEIYTQYQTSFTECKSHTRLEFVSSPKWVKTGSLIFAITGEKVEEIAPCVAYLGEEQCLAGGDTAVMEHNQNPSYLAYALMTTEAQRQKSRGKVKGKVVHSSIPDLKKVKIPLPEKSVQDKIASGLDAMRAVVAALDEEIAARREQFAGWLEKLMKFDAKEVA